MIAALSAPALLPLDEDSWTRLLSVISTGVNPEKAIKILNISPSMVDGALRHQGPMRDAWNEAKIVGGRISWPRSVIVDICAMIAAGTHTARQACIEHGKDPNGFLRLALRDPEIKDEYRLAQEIRAENFSDQTLELADDKDHDMDWDGKGNSANVKRSELQIKTRMELAKAANPAKYREKGPGGTAINVQQNVQNNTTVALNLNHAERLSAARRRKNQAATQAIPIVDAEFTPSTSNRTTTVNRPQRGADDWMDE